jgi:hypothetical protein
MENSRLSRKLDLIVMKKSLFILAFALSSILGFSQKLLTRSGEIKFDASMPDLAEVAAISKTVSAILDQSTGSFATNALIKSFRFKAPLMEEHFNENYMESSVYPNSKFVGKIINFDASKLSSTKSTYDLEGDLTIHGVTKKIKTKITLSSNAGKVTATSNFSVKAKEYKIEIPNLVKDKFAENIKVSVNLILEAK